MIHDASDEPAVRRAARRRRVVRVRTLPAVIYPGTVDLEEYAAPTPSGAMERRSLLPFSLYRAPLAYRTDRTGD